MKNACLFFLSLCVALSFGVPASEASPKRDSAVVDVVRDWGPNVVNIGTEKIVLLRQQPSWRGYGHEYDAAFQNFFGPQMEARRNFEKQRHTHAHSPARKAAA